MHNNQHTQVILTTIENIGVTFLGDWSFVDVMDSETAVFWKTADFGKPRGFFGPNPQFLMKAVVYGRIFQIFEKLAD